MSIALYVVAGLVTVGMLVPVVRELSGEARQRNFKPMLIVLAVAGLIVISAYFFGGDNGCVAEDRFGQCIAREE